MADYDFDEIEKQRIKNEKRTEAEEKRLQLAFKNVMKTEDGRKVLISIALDFCGALSMGRADEFQQGIKHVGLSLLDLMARADATATLQIIDEGHMNGYRRPVD